MKRPTWNGEWPTLDSLEGIVRSEIAARSRRPFVLGLCGAQGSGKSTLAEGLIRRLDMTGIKAAVLSIDDLYHTKKSRERLAREVHPLLRTRGVPGTHDVDLGQSVLAALDSNLPTALPRFDKSNDERMPAHTWPVADADTAVLILEGWCVGAVPQMADALHEPINMLERDEDGDGEWRAYVNNALAGDYQTLFGRIDFLALLRAPNFDVIQNWRLEQEQALRQWASSDAPGVMSDVEVVRFIQHYERLTRHIHEEMPDRADLAIALDENRLPIGIGR